MLPDTELRAQKRSSRNRPDAGSWRNRIVGQGVKPASEFRTNPYNWRVHPRPQQGALASALNEVGWVQQVVENVRTGNLIDGHLRVSLALRQGDDTPVPYVQVDLSAEEERLILASLDPIGAMAVADKAQLDALLREVSTGEAGLQTMLAELAEQSGLGYGLPSLVDVSDGEDTRTGRTKVGRSQAIVSLGTWSALVDYDLVQQVVQRVKAEFGEDPAEAIPRWCKTLCR